jgi:hypothetical protein
VQAIFPGPLLRGVGSGVHLWMRWFLPSGQAAERSQEELWSRVNSALADRVCNAVNREHVGGDAIVDPVRVCVADNVVE